MGDMTEEGMFHLVDGPEHFLMSSENPCKIGKVPPQQEGTLSYFTAAPSDSSDPFYVLNRTFYLFLSHLFILKCVLELTALLVVVPLC